MSKKVELATTTNITTTYAGEFAGKYITAALLEGVTLGNELISINQNIKYKWVVKKGDLSSAIADATCDFTPTGTIDLTERILEPEEFQINLLLCKQDYVSDWEAESMGFSAYDELPPLFSDWLIAKMLEVIAQKTETNIWQGVNANAGEFDGFTTLFAGDAAVVDVTSTAITSANVVAEMGKVVDAIPNTILYNEGLTLYISEAIARAYVRALGGFGTSGLGAAGKDDQGSYWYRPGEPMWFEGIKVVPVKGMPAAEMVAAEKENLWFGTGVMNDMNEVRLIDTAETLGDQNVRAIARWTGGVQYGISTEVVYYWANV